MNKEMIAHELLMPLNDFLGLLPKTKPRKSLSIIKSLYDDLLTLSIDTDTPSINEEGIHLTFDDVSNMYIESYVSSRRLISPTGAAKLIALYCAGVFVKTNIGINAIELQEAITYSQSHDELLCKTKEMRDNTIFKEMKKELLINVPSEVEESEFTYPLLDEIFIHHHSLAQGIQKMLIGDIEVTKTVNTYKSNSGINKDSKVVLSWTSTDGKPKMLTKGSAYTSNRRNDESRQYGLRKHSTRRG